MAIVAASIFSIALLRAHAEWWDVAIRLMFLGIGHAFFSSPNTNATMSSVERRQYGVAAAVLSTMRFTGQAISLAIATSVLSSKIGGIAISARDALGVPEPAFMSGMKLALMILSVICATGVFTSLVRGAVRSAQTPSASPAR
jgi:hypothetical protein